MLNPHTEATNETTLQNQTESIPIPRRMSLLLHAALNAKSQIHAYHQKKQIQMTHEIDQVTV